MAVAPNKQGPSKAGLEAQAIKLSTTQIYASVRLVRNNISNMAGGPNEQGPSKAALQAQAINYSNIRFYQVGM